MQFMSLLTKRAGQKGESQFSVIFAPKLSLQPRLRPTTAAVKSCDKPLNSETVNFPRVRRGRPCSCSTYYYLYHSPRAKVSAAAVVTSCHRRRYPPCRRRPSVQVTVTTAGWRRRAVIFRKTCK